MTTDWKTLAEDQSANVFEASRKLQGSSVFLLFFVINTLMWPNKRNKRSAAIQFDHGKRNCKRDDKYDCMHNGNPAKRQQVQQQSNGKWVWEKACLY